MSYVVCVITTSIYFDVYYDKLLKKKVILSFCFTYDFTSKVHAAAVLSFVECRIYF
jgi:hypothetical protein